MPGPVDALFYEKLHVCWEHVVSFHVNRQINESSGKVPEVFGGSRFWAREWLWESTGESPRQTAAAEGPVRERREGELTHAWCGQGVEKGPGSGGWTTVKKGWAA